MDAGGYGVVGGGCPDKEQDLVLVGGLALGELWLGVIIIPAAYSLACLGVT